MSGPVITEQTLRRGSDRSESGGASAGPSMPLMRNLDSEAMGLGVMGRAQGLGAAGVLSHTQVVQLPPVPSGGDSFKGVTLPEISRSSAMSASSRGEGDIAGPAVNQAPSSPSVAASRMSAENSFSELSMPSAPSLSPSSSSAPVSPPMSAPPTPFENVAAAAAMMENGSSNAKDNAFKETAANSVENAMQSMGQAASNLGNLFQDTKKGINPILQFGKELVKIVTGSLIAFMNFFFKPKT